MLTCFLALLTDLSLDLLAELHLAQASALNMRTLPGKDYLARAKICSKIMKYPTVEDYQVILFRM